MMKHSFLSELKEYDRGTRLLVYLAVLTIIFFGVNHAQSVVALFSFSVFLALIGTPPVLWLERKHVPSYVAVMIVVAGMIAILLVVGGIVGASLAAFSDNFPFYQKRLEEQFLALKPLWTSKHFVVSDKAILEYLNPGPVVELTVRFITEMGSALSSIVVILLTVIFMLLEASSMPGKLRAVLGDPHQAFPRFTGFVGDIGRYVVIKTLVSLATGILVGSWLFVLGVDFPILWGFLAFLLNFVPNVGSTIAAIPAVILAFLQLGLGSALMAAAGYMTVNFVLDNVIETRLMGQRLGLSTLVVFLSLIFWGSLLGPIGMVLCIPLTMTLRFVCESNDDTRWIATMLGPEEFADTMLPALKKKIRL